MPVKRTRAALKALKAMSGASASRWWRPRAARNSPAAHARFLSGVFKLAAKAAPPSRVELTVSFLVPLLDADSARLDALLDSFARQRPGSCELLLCDGGSLRAATREWLERHRPDAGVRIIRAEKLGAAVESGLAAARAPWIGRLDPDGALAPFALDRVALALAEAPESLFLYTDEVIADEKRRPLEVVLKPAWDPVLLSGFDYIGGLALYRSDRLREIGGWREQPAADHDLALRYTEGLDAKVIRHLPYPAYFRGRDEPEPGAILLDAERAHWPRVSVIIPSRDALPLIRQALSGLFEHTDYSDLEVIVVDNGSTDPRVLALYGDVAARESRFRLDIEPADFNFSQAINRGVALASGDLVLLLNNDVEILHRDWLKEMAACFDYADVGIVGAKLLYPDRTLQHAGVIAGLGGYAGHWFIGQGEHFRGPMGRLAARQSLSVVTGACMLVSREALRAVGPFDEAMFPVAYNDVDFCLRAVKAGYRVVWTPFAQLIHHESASRGSDETPANIARFNRDKANLRARHRTDVFEDRAFNPWYSRGESVPHPVLLDHLPKAR